MHVIDCKNNLKSYHIKDFISRVNDQNSIATLILENDDEHIFEVSVKDIRALFENDEVYTHIVDKTQQIDIVAEDVDLRFVGADYQWYARPVRGKRFKHVAELFEEKIKVKRDENASVSFEKTKRQKDNGIYKVAVGIISDNAIHDIKKMEGSQKEATDFINKMSILNRLRSFGHATTVFCINWQSEDELNASDNWKTMSELINEGVLLK